MLSNTLVLAHGHTHRKIQQISPDSILLDIDEDNNPDIIADLGNRHLLKEIQLDYNKNYLNQFNHVINAFAPTELVFVDHPLEDISIERNIDGALDSVFYKNVYNFLRLGGLYYTRPKFYYNASENAIPDAKPNIQLLTEKLKKFGFVLHQELFTLTFNETVIDDFIVYKKVEIPEIEDMVEYLKLQIQHNQVKYIYEKTEINDDGDYGSISLTRRNIKQLNLDEYFNFLPNYLDSILEYAYIKFDDTKVELI
jgi:hypothetical protein